MQLLLDFPVPYSPGSLVQGMVWPTVKMCLPTPVNLIEMICHRCAQRLISRVILDSVEMIVDGMVTVALGIILCIMSCLAPFKPVPCPWSFLTCCLTAVWF